MQVPRRKWFREENNSRFVAYPMGMLHMDRFAEIVFAGKLSVGNEIRSTSMALVSSTMSAS